MNRGSSFRMARPAPACAPGWGSWGGENRGGAHGSFGAPGAIRGARTGSRKFYLFFDFSLDNSLFVPYMGPANARNAPGAPCGRHCRPIPTADPRATCGPLSVARVYLCDKPQTEFDTASKVSPSPWRRGRQARLVAFSEESSEDGEASRNAERQVSALAARPGAGHRNISHLNCVKKCSQQRFPTIPRGSGDSRAFEAQKNRNRQTGLSSSGGSG